MSVAFTELDGSPRVDFSLDGVAVTRTCKLAWADRNQFVLEQLGQPDPVYTATVCHHILIEKFGGKTEGAGSLCAYEYAKAVMQYSTQPYVQVAEQFEPSAEFITLDPSEFKWTDADGDELQPEEAPGKLIVTLDYIMRWKNLAAVPMAALNLIGCVNSGPLQPSLVNARLVPLVFPAQTLLYHPPVINRTWDCVNNRASYDLMYRFQFRPNWDGTIARGWNWYWRSATGTYCQIYSTKTSSVYLNYPVADFALLWTP